MKQGTQSTGKLEGWDGERGAKEFNKKGIYVHLMQILVDVWQKPSQYCNVLSSN